MTPASSRPPRRRLAQVTAVAALAAFVAIDRPAVGLTPPSGSWTPTRFLTLDPLSVDESLKGLRVEGLGADRFLAVWHDSENVQPLNGLIVDAHGAAVGTPFAVTVAGRPVADLATAAGPAGEVLVAWSEQPPNGSGYAVHFRRYGADGRALHAPRAVHQSGGGVQSHPTAAFRADGAALLAWYEDDEVRGRLYDRDGQPIGEERVYFSTFLPYRLSLATIPEGSGFLLMAAADDSWRRLDPDGLPVGPVMATGIQPLAVLVELFALATDRFVALIEDPEWSYTCPSGVGFCGEPYNVALADPFDLDSTGLVHPRPLDDRAVFTPSAVLHGASLLVAWPESDAPVSSWARAVPLDATPRLVHDSPGRVETGLVDVGANGRGDAVVAWLATVNDDPYVAGRRVQLRLSLFQADGDGDGVVDADDLCPAAFDPAQIDADGDRLGAACDCDDADPLNLSLCLGPAGRFQLRAAWRTLDGATGDGRARPLTPDTGAFWFFASDNLELMVKVLDGCSVNDHWWIFAGGLTDVATRIEVVDRLTGARREWVTSAGSPFAPLQDTAAFGCELPAPACGSGDPADLAASPRLDRGSEELALLLGGEVVAPRALYERLSADLSAIRALEPGLEDLSFRNIWWGAHSLLLSLTEEAHQAAVAGSYHEWDCLNAHYRGAVEYLGATTLWTELTFAPRLHPFRAGRDYEALPGVTASEPNYYAYPAAGPPPTPGLCAAVDGTAVDYFLETAGWKYYRVAAPGAPPVLVGTWNGTAPVPAWEPHLLACYAALERAASGDI